MASPHINLDSNLGAAFLGNLAAAILYGITCVQAFTYYKKNYKDTTAFRLLVFFLWLLDTFHLTLITHALYYYLVSNYGNLSAIASPNWSITAQGYVTIISDGIIRIIFGKRVWLITGRNKFVVMAIFIPAALTFVSGFIFATRIFSVKTFANFSQISTLLYLSFGGGVVADMTIAGFLCTSLWRSRTGMESTDSVVRVLMMYTINTTLLTSLCCVASFIIYATRPHELTFFSVYFSLSKLYMNSLLATLNTRDALKEKLSGAHDIDLSDFSTIHMEFSSRAGDEQHLPQPIVVDVKRQVVVEESRAGTTKEDLGKS